MELVGSIKEEVCLQFKFEAKEHDHSNVITSKKSMSCFGDTSSEFDVSATYSADL